jgi:probable rRNA maturation factor
LAINFFTEDCKFDLKKKSILKKWVKTVIEESNFKIGNINYIFCSDNFILDINNRFLNHNYFTDIITFDNSEGNFISSDIYISIDTVRSNSVDFNVSFESELHRVMIHGILHLIGFDDTNETLKLEMHKMEDYHLSNLFI